MNRRLLSITRQHSWWSQDLPSALVIMENIFSELEIVKLPCYLPISGNYHLNNLSRLSGLIQKFALFHVTVCLFPRTWRNVVLTVAAWIFCFISKSTCIRFISFWMNIKKKDFYEHATAEMEYFHILLQFLSRRDSSQ